MTSTHDLSGALIEQQYPSGRVVRNVLDNDGSLSMVQSKKSLAHELIHADHAARGTRLVGTATYNYKDSNGRPQTAKEIDVSWPLSGTEDRPSNKSSAAKFRSIS